MDGLNKLERHNIYRERFIRWQQLTIEQLSYANNLFLVLALAFLSFFSSQTNLKFSFNCLLLTIQIFSYLSLGVSFIIGILTVLNRLKDFRSTHQLVKNKKLRFEYHQKIRENLDITKIESEINKYQMTTDELGPKTWSLFQWQIWSFSIGTLLGIIYLIIVQNS